MIIENLSYVKPEPFRDASRIVISCEGALTEPNYFKYFQQVSSKLNVHIIGQDEDPTLSAPKWVEDRTIRYIKKVGITKIDEVWLVIDVDRWTQKDFKGLNRLCKQHPKWNLVLSNPCFEVWLYLHKKNTFPQAPLNAQHLKYILSTQVSGGYNPIKYLPDIKIAIANARILEQNPKEYFPEPNTTKVHLLASRLIEIMGENHFQTFLKSIENKKG